MPVRMPRPDGDVVARVSAHADRRRVGHVGSLRSLSASHACSWLSACGAHATIASTMCCRGPLDGVEGEIGELLVDAAGALRRSRSSVRAGLRLQQRPARVPRPALPRLGARPSRQHDAVPGKVGLRVRVEDGAAAQGDDARCSPGRSTRPRARGSRKCASPALGEDRSMGPCARDDRDVGVEERHAQGLRDAAPDAVLPAPIGPIRTTASGHARRGPCRIGGRGDARWHGRAQRRGIAAR